MLRSIATVSLSGTLEQKLAAVAAAGFQGVEIFETDLITFPGRPRDIAGIAADLGLAITLFQPFRDLEGMPDDLRARGFDRLERKFDVMAELGAPLLLLCSNCSPLSLPDRPRIIADLQEAGERAAARGLKIGYEALAWGRHVSDHRDAWGLVRDADHPAIGLILDTFHSLSRRIPSSSIGDIRADKLFMVQVADAPLLDMDLLQWSRHFRCMPGQGDFALADWAEAIWRTGYQGWWSLEIFNDRFRAGSAHGVALDGNRSLLALHDAVARRPRSPLLPQMPPPVASERIAFIECAASHDDAAALGQMLAALGFTATARHRRKDVTRWCQGAINIVVNSEPEGFAHSFEMMHGASVCALGLVVDDVPAALGRAQALAVPRFDQAVGPDELDIPGVRGVGGSLLHFIADGSEADVWAHEFPLAVAPVTPVQPLGLTHIDHVAQTMAHEEFLSWQLFYVTLLAMNKTPQVQIADTLGLVHSQAVESPGKGVRITLNGSQSGQTLSSRFIQHYLGAGVQHIAFACPDIFAAARAAAANGLALLPIPPNYYDDIEARFGLAPDLVEQLRAHNILYDRDGDAEYFQLYSRAFARRVFFEIVERRQYQGYGAANAVVRLAAQARFKPAAA
ncbi:MAG: TIM barrel protein [Sphingomonadales bacterium]|jgi:4-hydroxyphenylpyruvate dioxygenase